MKRHNLRIVSGTQIEERVADAALVTGKEVEEADLGQRCFADARRTVEKHDLLVWPTTEVS